MSKKNFHGSDLEQIEKEYGIKKEDIVSFAANVNPIGVSERLLESIASNPYSIKTYPDREYSTLKKAISDYTGAGQDDIMVGNGVTELISKTIETINPKKVLMMEPTYSEYARKLSENHTEMASFLLKESDDFIPDVNSLIKQAEGDYDIIMLCNPNNPTGTALTALDIGRICKSATGKVLIDETYAEFTKEGAGISATAFVKDYENLIILRGTSKFFGVPGLRLGYLLCSSEEFKKKMKELMDPWTVNSIAAESAPNMFTDTEFIDKSRAFASKEMKRFVSELSKLRVHVYNPAANFVLVRIEKDGISSADVFEHCIKSGLMIRDCSSFKSLEDRHIRLCLNTKENNDRLINVLKEVL